MPKIERVRLHFTLPHDIERDIEDREIADAINRVEEAVERAYPQGLPQMKAPGTPEQRLFRYELLTDPIDLDILGEPGYIAAFKRGEAPLPQSEFWRQLIMFEDLFKATWADYMKVRGGPK